MEKKTIGSFIAALRKSHGMTQQELADRLSVSNKTISKWECGESFPEITLFPVIAEVFGVTSDEILRGERTAEKPASTEKSAAKVELQIKRLLHSSISKYKNLSYIAVSLFLTGYIMLLVLSFAANLPEIGFGVMLIFVIAGVVLEIININRTYAVFKCEDISEVELQLINPNMEILLKRALNVFSIAVAVVLMSLPAIIIFEVMWPAGITEMSDFNWYLWSIRHLVLAAIIFFWIARLVMHAVLSERDQYNGISVFSHDKRVTIVQVIVSVVLIILLI